MDMHTATEVSYKNGYKAGYEKAKEEFLKIGNWTDIYTVHDSHYIAVCSNCQTP